MWKSGRFQRSRLADGDRQPFFFALDVPRAELKCLQVRREPRLRGSAGDRNDPKAGLASPCQPANLSGLVLGCTDASDSESRLIFLASNVYYFNQISFEIY